MMLPFRVPARAHSTSSSVPEKVMTVSPSTVVAVWQLVPDV